MSGLETTAGWSSVGNNFQFEQAVWTTDLHRSLPTSFQESVTLPRSPVMLHSAQMFTPYCQRKGSKDGERILDIGTGNRETAGNNIAVLLSFPSSVFSMLLWKGLR